MIKSNDIFGISSILDALFQMEKYGLGIRIPSKSLLIIPALDLTTQHSTSITKRTHTVDW